MMANDLDLLRAFVRDHSQDAFAALVRRHINLVHSAALRQVGTSHLAEDVAQSVFTDLARNAHRLKSGTILTAWLYQVTRRTAIDLVRREAGRQARERIALEMLDMNANAVDWTHIAPLLDEAMHALDDTDRAAVLLRYFENKSLREVGEALGTSDDTAQKRVSRAVERLRGFLAKRGITVGASGLAVVISANAVQAAPVGLAVTLSTAAVVAGTSLTTSATGFSTTLIQLMASTKIKMAGVTLALGLGVATWVVVQEQALASLRDEHRALKTKTQPLNELRAENERLAREANLQATAAKQRQEITRLRASTASAREALRRLAAEQASAANGRAPAAQEAAPVPQSFQLAALKDVGALTPMAAVQTSFWAMRNQSAERLKELFYVPENLAGAEKEQFEKTLEEGVAAQVRKASLPGWNQYQEIRLLEQFPTKTENEYRLALQARGTAGWKRMDMTVRPVNGQWKFVFQGSGRPEGGLNESK